MLKKTFISLILVALLFSCGKKEHVKSYDNQGKPAYGDTMITSSIGEASNLIPVLASDSASHEIASYVFNGLVKYDKNLNIVGDLAESWDFSTDKLAITFHLRKNVRWHDGQPFTARDVLFTYQATVDPKTPTAYAGDFQQVKRAEIIDDYTFRVTYDKPFAPALPSWGSAILPSHLLKGKDITKSALARHPIGTGPYKFKEWIPGDRIVLTANDDYFEGRPYISRRVFRVIPDSATTFLELKNFNIDMAGLSPLQYMRQTDYEKFRRNYNKYKYLSFTYVYLGYNLRHPFFKDKRVRQALTYAIDKQEIIDGIVMGLAVPAEGPYKPDMWAYNADVKKYPFDPKKAAALLQEAGFVKGKDGRLYRNGTPFEFTIITNQGNDVRIRAAELIQRRLGELGITVKIRVLEWAAFVTQFIDKRNFDATILGWTMVPDPDPFDVWHSSKQGPKELNFIGYENKEVDELILKARHTYDQEERKRCYWRIQEILAEEQPYTFLFIPYATVAIHKRFKGIDPGPAGLTHNIIKWYVPEEQMRYKNVAVHP
ncbi:MAG: Oligopeptide-binding protein AppA precursor [Syntrophorhabdaceae bacterium PtaU1.Bin034]|nr:MAG: Oligopeptide-binding protein AppA precursor [Syntrophorhabdaceae bacterium PtaU1.Bin034]